MPSRFAALLIRGSEITRNTSPGHFNALFLNDSNPLDTPDFVEAIKQANQSSTACRRPSKNTAFDRRAWEGESGKANFDKSETCPT